MGFAKEQVLFAKNCHFRLKMKELRSTAKNIYIYIYCIYIYIPTDHVIMFAYYQVHMTQIPHKWHDLKFCYLMILCYFNN